MIEKGREDETKQGKKKRDKYRNRK